VRPRSAFAGGWGPVYRAIFQFNSEAVCHPAHGLPKPTDETVFEVEVEGVIHTRTFRQAMAWSNARSSGYGIR
jgi:hypothetical protein